MQLGHLARGARSATSSSTSGPLISFGSSPSPQPTPSFWNEPTTKADSGQAELAPRLGPRRGVAEPEAIGVDTDRDPEHLLRRDARSEHELLHGPVRDLDAVELLVPPPHRLVAGVELGHARRARPPVQVRDAEPVAVPLEREPDQRELARVEDGLVADAGDPAAPGRRRTPSLAAIRLTSAASSAIAHAVPVAGDEQPRVRRARTACAARSPARAAARRAAGARSSRTRPNSVARPLRNPHGVRHRPNARPGTTSAGDGRHATARTAFRTARNRMVKPLEPVDEKSHF